MKHREHLLCAAESTGQGLLTIGRERLCVSVGLQGRSFKGGTVQARRRRRMGVGGGKPTKAKTRVPEELWEREAQGVGLPRVEFASHCTELC